MTTAFYSRAPPLAGWPWEPFLNAQWTEHSPETDFDDYICPAEEDSLCFLTIIKAELPTRSTTCYSSGPPSMFSRS